MAILFMTASYLAQSQNFTIQNNFVLFEDPFADPTCDETIRSQDCWTSTQIRVQVDHDIYSPNSPFLTKTINNASTRFAFFDIFHVSPDGSETLVASIEKLTSMMLDEVTYSLDISELQAAGVPAGETIIRLRVVYTVTEVAYLLALSVQRNGDEICFTDDLEGASNSLPGFECELGFVDCFDYAPCNREIELQPSLSQQIVLPGGNIGCLAYFPIDLTGGSTSNLSVNWLATNGAMGTTLNHSIIYDCEVGHGFAYEFIRIIDNSTGCIYYWETEDPELLVVPPSTNEVLDFNSETMNEVGFAVYPNPISSSSALTFEFHLENPAPVTINLIDQNGRSIQTILNNVKKEEGNHTFISNIDIPAGLYFIDLKIGNEIKALRKLSITH